jgi:hypothetical protein
MNTAPSRAEVTLSHKTGPVVITILAQDPKVSAYMANRIKEVFESGKKIGPVDDLLRRMGFQS